MSTKEAREGLQDMFKKRAREFGSMSMDSMAKAGHPFTRSRTGPLGLGSSATSVGLGSASFMSNSGATRRGSANTKSEKTVFPNVDRQAAVKLVQRGCRLTLTANTGSSHVFCGGLKRFCKRWKRPNFYFVVTESRAGHYELRWDTDPEKAPTSSSHGRILLSDIRDVAATTIQDEDLEDDNPHSVKFRIFYLKHHLKLVAPDRASMKEWVVGLMFLARQNKGSSMRHQSHSIDGNLRGYIESVFNSINVSKSVSRSEALSEWLWKLNISSDDDYVNDIVLEFDKDNSSSFTLDEFTELFHLLTVREALVPWFEKYSKVFQAESNESAPADILSMHRAMSAERFQLFLELEQGENYFFSAHSSLKGSGGLFESQQPPFTEIIKGMRVLTLAGFSRLMTSAENSIFDPERRARVGQDMTRPLSHYWIASSHNTYLEGHQLVGTSSLEQYIDVLLRGCRCVEIDCWDGDDGEPIVTHGWTATSKLRFKDVISVCRDYAFVASVYPLILSLEVHCSAKQQDRMGEILGDQLGDTLLRPDPDNPPEGRELISPEAAKLKVIVKAKQPGHGHKKNSDKSEKEKSIFKRCLKKVKKVLCCCCRKRKPKDFDDSRGSVLEDDTRSSVTSENRSSLNSLCHDDVHMPQSGEPSDVPRDADASRASNSWRSDEIEKQSRPEVAPMYKKTIYLSGQSLKKDDVALSDAFGQGDCPCPSTCVSLNDQRAIHLIDKQADHVVSVQKVFRHQLIRVYPHKHRVGSGNYNPFDMWLSGVSMVALNYQNLDLHIICNEGLFLNENGGSGYILKPQVVRGSDAVAQDTAKISSPVTTPRKLDRKGSRRPSAGEDNLSQSWRNITSRNKARHNSNSKDEGGKALRHQDSHVTSSSASEQIQAFKDSSPEDSPRSRQDREDSIGLGHSCSIEVTVLSAHWLPKPEDSKEINPLVRVSICGAYEDRRSAETWRITDNGFNPRWHQLFSFHVKEPTISVLAFEVVNIKVGMRKTSREFVAAAAFPFSGLREGIRWVPLLDGKHHPIDLCGLLVEIRIRGAWAELRRHQRLARTVVPSSIARIVGAGHGGLDSNEGSLTRQSTAARRKSLHPGAAGAANESDSTHTSGIMDGASMASNGSATNSIEVIVNKHPMLSRSATTAGFAGQALRRKSVCALFHAGESDNEDGAGDDHVSNGMYGSPPPPSTPRDTTETHHALSRTGTNTLVKTVSTPDLVSTASETWRTPREPKVTAVSLKDIECRGVSKPPRTPPINDEELVIQTPRTPPS